MKHLIINADDFGYSKIFNQEILNLIEKDLISSTTVIVDRITKEQEDQIKELVELSKPHNLSVGLHLEFQDNLNFQEEIQRQHDKFISIFNFKPSHLDLHRSTYKEESYPFIQEFCKENNLPCRNVGINNKDVITTDNEEFSGTHKRIEELKKWVESIKENQTYEIVFHPGKYDPNSKSSLNKNREKDVENIIKLKLILEENNIRVVSYLDLKNKKKE